MRITQVKKKKKNEWNDNRRVRHYLSWLVKQKEHIFINNESEVHIFKQMQY